ncbi:unnamed protein product, partial [Medioppia subpectinata]
AAKMQQKIRNEEMEIDVVERHVTHPSLDPTFPSLPSTLFALWNQVKRRVGSQISVEEKEILRKDKELIAMIKLPAEAEASRVELIAQGKAKQTVEASVAEGQKIKMIGAADAYAIEAIGKAEAEMMRMKAAAYKQYGEAAILSLTLEALPKIAAEVAAPLAKTDEIVLISGSDGGLTSDVTRLVSQIPPTLHALTGVDLSKVLGKIPGAK